MKRLRANNQIRSPEVMTIDETGKQLGIMQTSKAIEIARQLDLDLVEISPTAQPPIAKIMDFGKYMYQLEKKEKQSSGRHKEHETKTVRVGYKTGEHDLAFKAEKADEFLTEGHNVKLELTLRGREKALAHLGREKLFKFMERLTTPIIRQSDPTRSPYGWVVMVQKDRKAKQPMVNNQQRTEKQNNNEDQKSAPKAHQDNETQKDTQTPPAPESL